MAMSQVLNWNSGLYDAILSNALAKVSIVISSVSVSFSVRLSMKPYTSFQYRSSRNVNADWSPAFALSIYWFISNALVLRKYC